MYVEFSPEERAHVQLLSVLYACVFWRGEAQHLGILLSLKSFSHPPPETNWQVGFFFLEQTSFRVEKEKRKCLSTSTPKF
jgi:hypothetical protein